MILPRFLINTLNQVKDALAPNYVPTEQRLSPHFKIGLRFFDVWNVSKFPYHGDRHQVYTYFRKHQGRRSVFRSVSCLWVYVNLYITTSSSPVFKNQSYVIPRYGSALQGVREHSSCRRRSSSLCFSRNSDQPRSVLSRRLRCLTKTENFKQRPRCFCSHTLGCT
jgi:hypothetical protein